MPYGDPDPGDPNVLVGVAVSGDEHSLREMAMAFAEEFAALGFGEERLMGLFRSEHYAAAHRAYRLLGEAEIQRMVRESLALWGRFRVVVQDAPEEAEPLVQLTVPEPGRDD